MPTGTSAWRARKRGDQVEAVAACARRRRARARAAAWITGPSATGSENGMPSSTMSAPPSTSASSKRGAGRRGRDRRASGRRRTRPRRGARSARTSRRSGSCARLRAARCACAMSLSPRPDRLTSRIGSSSRSSASFSAWASAWQLSNAQMMPFAARQRDEGVERLAVRRADIVGAADVLEMGMLGADRGIIEAGRDRPAVADLPVLVLQDIGLGAVEDARAARAAGSRHARAPSRPLPAASTPISATPRRR